MPAFRPTPDRLSLPAHLGAAATLGPMALDPSALPAPALEFLAERHLATLTTLRPDGSPHVVAIAFTWDPNGGMVRIITSARSRKVRNLQHGGRAVVCQVEGPRWLSLEGTARVRDHPAIVADAEARYADRYAPPSPNPERVVIEIEVDRVLGRP